MQPAIGPFFTCPPLNCLLSPPSHLASHPQNPPTRRPLSHGMLPECNKKKASFHAAQRLRHPKRFWSGIQKSGFMSTCPTECFSKHSHSLCHLSSPPPKTVTIIILYTLYHCRHKQDSPLNCGSGLEAVYAPFWP